MEKELSNEQMDQNMMGNGKMGSKMDSEQHYLRVEINMRDSTKMVENKEMEYFSGELMETSMKDNLTMVIPMDRGYNLDMMELR